MDILNESYESSFPDVTTWVFYKHSSGFLTTTDNANWCHRTAYYPIPSYAGVSWTPLPKYRTKEEYCQQGWKDPAWSKKAGDQNYK